MKTFIDESGLFVVAQKPESWNVVCALTITENSMPDMQHFLNGLKKDNSLDTNNEMKLKDVSEESYINFITELSKIQSTLCVAAVDSGRNSRGVILEHKKGQVGGILKNIDKMQYLEGRNALEMLASMVSELPLQLYVQIQCQVQLINSVINKSINYFIQRDPATLSKFMWYIDQKNTTKTDFEKAFEYICPMLLQTLSIKAPIFMIKEFDYSVMSEYLYFESNTPTYLKDTYSIKSAGGLNIQKIIRENIEFVDSKQYDGIQVIDLLASGVRRCLRSGFKNNEEIASLLGSIMIQEPNNASPINLVSFDKNVVLVGEIEKVLKLMSKNCKPMFLVS